MNKELEIKNRIADALQKLSLVQQVKLLDFINAMVGTMPEASDKNKLLKFAGVFDEKDIVEMKSAIKDCEKIDKDEW